MLGLWWEAGFDPLDEANPGFVDAFADALRAHMAFGGVRKLAMPRTGRTRRSHGPSGLRWPIASCRSPLDLATAQRRMMTA